MRGPGVRTMIWRDNNVWLIVNHLYPYVILDDILFCTKQIGESPSLNLVMIDRKTSGQSAILNKYKM